MFARFVPLALLSLALGCANAAHPAPSTPHADQLAWASACEDFDDWDKAGPPFHIYGNTYYVGTCGIGAILITGDQGHVLIDGGPPNAGDLIAANIKALGFALSDVKLLLHSHEHLDHVGGLARLQQLTGARLIASAGAAPVLASGAVAADDPQFGTIDGFPAVRVDSVLQPGELVKLGDLSLTPLATPGHTEGALSWAWRSCEGSDCRSIVYADSLSPVSGDSYRFSDHPAYLAAYRASLKALAALAPCDIVITPHPSASEMRKRMLEGELFAEPRCAAYAGGLSARLDERLAREAGKGGAGQ